MLTSQAKLPPGFCGKLREVLSEQEAIAGFVAGKPQRADELFLHARERRFVLEDRFSVEQLVRHAVRLEDFDVLGGAIELLLRAEQLQRTQRALVVGDAGVGAQLLQAIAAVLGQPHHARLVAVITRGRAVAQHRDAQRHIARSSIGLITSGR